MESLPDSAQICSCFDVTKGDIIQAIHNGCQTVADIKAETKAGTGCGGCVPLITQVLNAELTNLGIEVNHHLCEHFAYSRQELYHLIRVEKITTFDELLGRYGEGYGCEVCKPTIGSLLASCRNDYILRDDLVPLQDTNDNFLANMQKDGTYSVIPRSPGGEITGRSAGYRYSCTGIQSVYQNYRLTAHCHVRGAKAGFTGYLGKTDRRRI